MNILLVTGQHIKASTPDAYCVDALVTELHKNKSLNIDIVSDGLNQVKNDFSFKNHPLKSLERILYWPVKNPDDIRRKKKMCKDIMAKKRIDVVIGVCNPYDAVYTANYIKKQNKNIIFVFYELDPIDNEIERNLGIGKYIYFLRCIAEKRIMNHADYIFHMRCNENKYNNRKFSKYIDKSFYLDFPLIHHEKRFTSEGKQYQMQTVNMIYSGRLDQVFRSPVYLLNVMVYLIGKNLKFSLDFYTFGNCEEIVRHYANDYNEICQNGYVEKQQVDESVEKSDFLISISNKYSNMLPSKVLHYIQSGKPIIHISSREDDICIDYLKKYPFALVIYESDDIEVSGNKILEFIQNNYKKRADADTICDIYYENTPEYSAKKILEVLTQDN